MLRIKPSGPAILAATALGAFAPAALGDANPASHGCNGNTIARENHLSGPVESPSRNPNASVGPGYVHGGESPGSVAKVVQEKRSSC